MQIWEKIDFVYGGTNYAAVPFGIFIDDDTLRIFFSSRNDKNQSIPFFLDYNIHEKEVKYLSNEPLLKIGDIGTFDDSGIMPTCAVEIGKSEVWLYYIGWNLGITVPFRNSLGLAVSNDRGITFKKLFEGPVLDRNKTEPYFNASCSIIKEGDLWRNWYVSCIKWELEDEIIKHHYHIKYAESNDGINWIRDRIVAIDFKHEGEYAISVPRVIKEDKIYKMWYSYRANGFIKTYRIGYAESTDGIVWQRKDEEVNLDVSSTGWDSEMVCYPFIFDHKGERYMLYNGNGYGKTGFGIAKLKR